MVNQQVLEGHWNDIKGQIQEAWGQLTEDDLQQARGNVKQLVGVIQRKTGEARERIEKRLEEFMAENATAAERGTEAARNFVDNAGRQARETYEQTSAKLQDGYRQAEATVQARPIESVAVAFGTGLIAGTIIGLVMRSR